MTEEDAGLALKIADGDGNAFEAILKKYEKTIFNIVYRMVRDYDDATDITQTVFIKVFEKVDTYKPQYKFFSWLCRIAVNQSINHLKSRKKMVDLDCDLLASHHTPEDHAAHREVSEYLQEAMMDLKIDHRVVIILKYFLGISYREIGDIAGIPEKTVKSRLLTARRALRSNLIERGYAR